MIEPLSLNTDLRGVFLVNSTDGATCVSSKSFESRLDEKVIKIQVMFSFDGLS